MVRMLPLFLIVADSRLACYNTEIIGFYFIQRNCFIIQNIVKCTNLLLESRLDRIKNLLKLNQILHKCITSEAWIYNNKHFLNFTGRKILLCWLNNKLGSVYSSSVIGRIRKRWSWQNSITYWGPNSERHL